MARELKFRAWIDNGLDDPYMAIQGTPDLETLQSFMFHYGDRPLMQFTGLLDKNGKEIYEGDIISEQGAFIVWDNILACWCFDFKDSKNTTPLFYDKSGLDTCKVIGNIYENPELIKC